MVDPHTENEKEQIKRKSEQNKKYIEELNTKLCDYDDVIAQRDKMKCDMSTSLAELDSVKTKQMDKFNEQLCKYNEINNNYNTDREKFTKLIKENDCLRNENEKLHVKLNEQEMLLEESENIHSTLLRDAQKLQIKFEDVTEIANKCKDRKRLTEIELRSKGKNLICDKNALSEKIMYHTQLEKKFSMEQSQNECMRSSINELKRKYDNTLRCLKSKITEQQSKLNEKLPKLTAIKRKLKGIQEEVETKNYQTIELKKKVQELRQFYLNEKNKADKVVCELKTEVKTKALDLESVNIKLCNAQVENARHQCQLKDQEETIKRLEPTIENLHQKVRTMKEATELTTNIIKIECEQHVKEVIAFQRKFEFQNHEEDELKRLISKQNEQIKKLKKQLFDKKFKTSIVDSLEMCVDILSEKNQKPVPDQCKLLQPNDDK